jgi:hypothetical protein
LLKQVGWGSRGAPELVDIHDFPGDVLGKPLPYVADTPVGKKVAAKSS